MDFDEKTCCYLIADFDPTANSAPRPFFGNLCVRATLKKNYPRKS